VALIDDLRVVVDDCRGILGELGFREHSATIVKTIWSGGRTGAGDKFEEEYPLYCGNQQNPKIKFPNQRDIALGLMSLGIITIGPLTPEFTRYDTTTGGILRDIIALTEAERSDTVHILVTGPQHPNGAKYRIKNLNADRALRVMITAVVVSGN
jgi:hypothetical protein